MGSLPVVLTPGLPPSHAARLEACYASAHRALADEDDRNATRLFVLMALLSPRDERAWLGLGVCNERAGRLEAAAALFAVGAVLSPESPFCHLGRGRVSASLGRRAEAEAAFDTARALADEALRAAIDRERQELT